MDLLKRGLITISRRFLLLFTCLALVTTNALGQDGKVSMSSTNMTVGQAIKEIEAQTGYIFAINNSNLSVSQQVRFSKQDLTLPEGLDQMLAGSGQTHEITGKHIIIVAQKESKPVVAKTGYEPIILTDIEITKRSPAANEEIVQAANEITEIVTDTEQGPYHFESSSDFVLNTTIDGARTPIPARDAKWAVKTNLLYGAATLTPNLGVEIALGPKTTLDISGGYNPWNLKGSVSNNTKFVHWLIQPEFRYWTCERFNGHFFGIHALASNYNISGHNVPLLFDKQYRYQGSAFGGGISYGYHWMLNKNWGIEFNAGIGVAALKYDKFNCQKCNDLIQSYNKTYFGPTKAGITLIYLFK